jgi:hypothetical protein
MTNGGDESLEKTVGQKRIVTLDGLQAIVAGKN